MKTNTIQAKRSIKNEYLNAKYNAQQYPFNAALQNKFLKVAEVWRSVENLDSRKVENKDEIFNAYYKVYEIV